MQGTHFSTSIRSPSRRWSHVILSLLVSTASSCSRLPQGPPVQLTPQCLGQPPPILPPGASAEAPTECPPHFVCRSEIADILETGWIVKAVRWMAKAWVACGPAAHAAESAWGQSPYGASPQGSFGAPATSAGAGGPRSGDGR